MRAAPSPELKPLDRPLDDEKGLLLEHFVAQELHRRMGTLWLFTRLAGGTIGRRKGSKLDAESHVAVV